MTQKRTSPPLRAVGVDETAPKKAPVTVAEAAKIGTPRELLVATRDRVAAAVSDPKCPPQALAALTNRLQQIVQSIDAMDAREDADLADRVRELESALRGIVPEHPLLCGSEADGDKYDASAI